MNRSFSTDFLSRNAGLHPVTVVLPTPKTPARYRIAITACLLLMACVFIYYFHFVRRQEEVFTHLFHIPIILACIWWKRKGLIVAAFLSVLLILSDVIVHQYVETLNDYLRAGMLMITGLVVSTLSERIAAAQNAARLAALEIEQIFHTAADAMCVLDKDCCILRINSTALKMVGLSENETVGRKCYEVFGEPGCRSPSCPLNRILSGEEIVEREIEMETGQKGKILCSVKATPFRNMKGVVVGIVENIRDITESRQAEESLRRSQEQLFQAQKMEALGTLVAGIAHEINNPLNLITMNIRILQKIWADFEPILDERKCVEPDKKYGGLTYEFLKENLNQLFLDTNMGANRITRLVTDLKNYARSSDLRKKQPVSLNVAVENALRLAQTTIRHAKVDLDLDLVAVPLVQGNLPSMEQIVLNVVLNGIQAIRHDHGKLRIASGVEKGTNQVFISISDNGEGISEEISHRIFDPFFTSKMETGGTGLGLSITHKLVRAYGGEIGFQSKIGQGTTFTIRFPIDRSH